ENRVVDLANTLFPKKQGNWSIDEPQIWQEFAKLLTEGIAEYKIERVVTWNQIHSSVLANHVALEIDAKTGTAFADEGLLGVDRVGEERVLLLDVDWPIHPPASALASYINSRGYEVVAVASVLAPREPIQDLPN